MLITITPAPVVNAGVDQTVCESSPDVVLNGSVTVGSTTGIWSGGAGTYNPNNTTLTAIYTPSAGEITAGTVTLTLTATGACSPLTDAMVITITPLPVVNAGVDQTVCANNVNVTLNGSVTVGGSAGQWSGGAGVYNPNNTALTAIYTPSAGEITAGTVTLTLT